MTHKNIKMVILLLMAASLLGACKKELNVLPSTSEVDGNVIIDAKSAATVLNGVYEQFADAGTDYRGVLDEAWSSQFEAPPSGMSGSLVCGNSFVPFPGFTFSPLNGADAQWGNWYAIVNAANGFLKNVAPVNSIPEATKKQMIAEAKFLRAYADANLLLYFGQYNDVNSKYGILLRTDFVTGDNITGARSSVADSYTAILADLEAAIPALPAQNTSVAYANASAAKLLEARVLINRGTSGDYAKVISLTNDVITNGPFALEANTKDIFLTKGFTSKEVILGVAPYPNQNNKSYNFQWSPFWYASDSLVSRLQNDPRSQWVTQTVNVPYQGVLPIITKYYSARIDYAGPSSDGSPTTLAETSYVIRLTEAYMLEAEAITLSAGDLSQAKTLLKTVEGHAGITDFSAINTASTAAALQLLIVKEDLMNFVAENGADWLALRRLPLATLQTIQPILKDQTRLIFPIPNAEIIANSKMIQNPGY